MSSMNPHSQSILPSATLSNGCTIKAIAGSLLDFTGDAIINAANTGGVTGFGIDETINRAAGDDDVAVVEAAAVHEIDIRERNHVRYITFVFIFFVSCEVTLIGAVMMIFYRHPLGSFNNDTTTFAMTEPVDAIGRGAMN